MNAFWRYGKLTKAKPQLQLKLAHKGLILVCLPLFFELVFVAVLGMLLEQADNARSKEVRSKSIIAQASELIKLSHDASSGPVNYGFTGAQEVLESYDNAVKEFPVLFRTLKELTKDNPVELAMVTAAETDGTKAVSMLTEYRSLIENEDRVGLMREIELKGPAIRKLLDRFSVDLRSLMSLEQQVEKASPEAESHWRALVSKCLLGGTFVNIALAMYMAIFFITNVVNRLLTLTDNSLRLGKGEKLNVPLQGNDEIAILDRCFHEMARELAESDEKERAILENTLDVICTIDAEGKFSKVSPTSERVLGYTPEELIGTSYTSLLVSEEVLRSQSEMEKAMKSNSRVSFENTVIHKSGLRINVLWSVYRSVQDQSVFCVAHDITTRKMAENALRASEARTRAILEGMPAGLLILTPIGVIEQTNPKVEEMLGYSAVDLMGKGLVWLLHNHPNQTFSGFMNALRQKEIDGISHWAFIRSNGSLLSTEMSIKEFASSDGPRLLAIILDVSERQKFEKLKKEFVSMVSHELRTPLTSIRGSLGLVNVGVFGQVPQRASEAILEAEKASVRLVNLINDLLDLQKLESGQFEMHFDKVKISSVVERSLESVRGFADQHNIRIDVDAAESSVQADEDRLVQVLVNLLSNAIKFSPAGEQVMVKVAKMDESVRFQVQDHGRGIPASHKDLIFERFQQIEQSDSREKGGTGLGLAICKEIIERHGGVIGVESVEGKGSTFWYQVPGA
jgi:PAS domain S-box-containing protein